MRSSLSTILIIAMALLVSSCSPYGRLAKDFAGKQTSIQFIHSPGKSPVKFNISVGFVKPVITDAAFKSGQIKNVKTEIIPAIIYTGWTYFYECSIGRNQVKEKLDSFVQSSLVEEGNRKGIFTADTSSNHPYTVEIEIDSIRSAAIHKTTGHFVYLFFFATWGSSTNATGNPAYCRFHYRLRKGEKVIVDKSIGNYSTIDFLRPFPFDEKTFNVYLRAYLVESLGDAIRKNIEAVVREVNRELRVDPMLTQ
ncbi:MAG TPA: hypothetical protein VL728_08810 [Cyclobacteriaceae bacterium]|jgi:hypothetical protein|nr:hypothetical protein [Cyclobacteriaceae bacterium]